MDDQLFLKDTHDKVLKVLRMADYLSSRYHVVVANPPNMEGKGMNGRFKAWAQQNYPDGKTDLFAVFILRNLAMVITGGSVAMITMQSWMFLSSYEALRTRILDKHITLSMAHLGARALTVLAAKWFPLRRSCWINRMTRHIKALLYGWWMAIWRRRKWPC